MLQRYDLLVVAPGPASGQEDSEYEISVSECELSVSKSEEMSDIILSCQKSSESS